MVEAADVELACLHGRPAVPAGTTSRPQVSCGSMDRYDPKTIEPKWQRVWADEHTWEVSNEPDERPKAYVLEMLPYPSGEPHIGHLKNSSLGDAIAHFCAAAATACCTRWATTPSGCLRRTTQSR